MKCVYNNCPYCTVLRTLKNKISLCRKLVLQGEFLEEKKHGTGTYKFPSGNIYSGSYEVLKTVLPWCTQFFWKMEEGTERIKSAKARKAQGRDSAKLNGPFCTTQIAIPYKMTWLLSTINSASKEWPNRFVQRVTEMSRMTWSTGTEPSSGRMATSTPAAGTPE